MSSNNFWTNKKVAVLGGAALIGSHLVEALRAVRCKSLWIFDDLSSGKTENIPSTANLFIKDLRDYGNSLSAVWDADVVFHLACAHGGRGYVDTHEVACYGNLELDATVFRACANKRVGKVVFASSACVYTMHLQREWADATLSEEMFSKTQINADGAYGFAKAAAELSLEAYVRAGAFKGVACRQFTVYGPRMAGNHAIGALIAKTFIKQEPFEIWGNGDQKRNWTYVTDTVRGLILAAENMDSGAVNIGTEEVWTPNMAAELIWDIMGWRPKQVMYLEHKPTGPVNRIADASKAREQLGWQPQVSFRDGLERTIDWYVKTHDVAEVRANLEKSLTER